MILHGFAQPCGAVEPLFKEQLGAKTEPRSAIQLAS